MRRQGVVMTAAAVLALILLPFAWGATAQVFSITMRDYSYTPAKITVRAGVPVVFTLINKGKVPHEFMLYGTPKSMNMMMGHEWAEKTNYFQRMRVDVTGGKVRHIEGDFFELKLATGKTATLKFTPVKKGIFEFGCMVEGHYEAGQKGVLVVK